MAAQNRIYEAKLKRVEQARNKFNLLKFQLDNEMNGVDTDKVEKAFVALRTEMADSLAFANEAYMTAGGVIGVVGNKQQLTRMFGKGDEGGVRAAKKNSVALTADEYFQMLNEQVGDVFKEATRHFEETNDLPDTAIAAGKYIHRAYNATKHLYRLVNQELTAMGQANKEPKYTEAQRTAAADLEGLKKGQKRAAPDPGRPNKAGHEPMTAADNKVTMATEKLTVLGVTSAGAAGLGELKNLLLKLQIDTTTDFRDYQAIDKRING